MLRRLLGRTLGDERGQVLMLAMFAILAVAVTAALAVDLGMWLRDRRDAQNDVDAGVLAGVLDLPPLSAAEENDAQSAAAQAATDWVAKNGADGQLAAYSGSPDGCASTGSMGTFSFFDCDGDGLSDTIGGQIERQSPSFFARIIGFGDVTLRVRAAAQRVRAYGAYGSCWAVFGTSYDPDTNFGIGDPYALYTFHAGDPISPGNFNAINTEGGVNSYKDCIIYGSPLPAIEGGTVDSEPGEFGVNTCDALYDRTQPVEGDVPPCSPTSSGSAFCDATSWADAESKAYLEVCSERLFILPITEPFEQGQSNVLVYSLATFYAAGWDRNPPFDSGFDADADGKDDVLWGYFLPDFPWYTPDLLIDPDKPGGPLAPAVPVLVE